MKTLGVLDHRFWMLVAVMLLYMQPLPSPAQERDAFIVKRAEFILDEC